MQPNHTCLHSNFSNKLKMNVLDSKYTLSPSGSPYNSIPSFFVKGSEFGPYFGTKKNEGGSEAALSMFVAVNTNNTAGIYPVIRDYSLLDNVIPTEEKILCLSDGETTYKTSAILENDTLGYTLKLGRVNTMLGVVSITEPFTIETNYKINGEYERGIIGTSVSICPEVDEIVEDLMNEEGIDFSITSSTKKFVSPNFQGSTLLDSVNYLLRQKDLTLYKDGDDFSIIDIDSATLSPDILISDDGDYLITSYEKARTSFDRYNSIVVYGRQHKATKRNVSDIKKNGTKTLEVIDRTLLSQEDVNDKAMELFILHNKTNEKLIIELAPKSTVQFKPGDIVQVEIRRENIPRNSYYILETEYNITGSVKLTLGKFSKNIGDRFAELLISNNNINAFIRESISDSTIYNLDFLSKVHIRPLRLLVRKATPSSGYTFGFSTTLGFSTTFLGSTNTLETLLEVDY